MKSYIIEFIILFLLFYILYIYINIKNLSIILDGITIELLYLFSIVEKDEKKIKAYILEFLKRLFTYILQKQLNQQQINKIKKNIDIIYKLYIEKNGKENN